MKILVLVDELHRAGGLERSLATKAHGWLAAGHQVEVLTLNAPAADFFPLSEQIGRPSLGICYRRDESLLSYRNAVTAIRHFRLLRRFLRLSKHDFIINSGYGFDFYFLPLLRRRSSVIIKENHSSRYPSAEARLGWWGRIKSKLRRTFESLYDYVLFLSAEEAALSGLGNARVIPNAIELDDLSRSYDRKSHVIAAGRICPVKGFDRLVNAWAIAASRLPGWSLHIYGDGEPGDISALRKLISSHGLDASAHLWPATSDIRQCMAESRIYAMTSRGECFPMVLLEAMQLGLPIVAFDCPTGPRNIVDQGVNGELVPEGDTKAFAEALVSLALDPARQDSISRAARYKVRQFEVSQVMPMWEGLFRGCR